MGYSNKRSQLWQKQNKEIIYTWKTTLKSRLSMAGYFNYERLEMEVLQLIEDSELKEIWQFSCDYIHTHKNVRLRNVFIKAKNEIQQFGSIEPVWKSELNQLIVKEKLRKHKRWLYQKK
jgi:hypothetical protein